MAWEFNNSDSRLSLKDMAYDLAVVYAKTKLAFALQRGAAFQQTECAPPEEIQEMEYLLDRFFSALDYFCNIEAGELESRYAAITCGLVRNERYSPFDRVNADSSRSSSTSAAFDANENNSENP